jgi:hypothetical protein
MKNQTSHTPTPWIIYGTDADTNEVEICQAGITNIAKRNRIANVLPKPEYDNTQKANAEYIVRAVNAYDELVNCLKSTLDMLNYDGLPETDVRINQKRRIRKAIAQASGI